MPLDSCLPIMSGEDSEDVKTDFQMTITEESAQYLDSNFPDQLKIQEQLRAAIAELRVRREMHESCRDQRD